MKIIVMDGHAANPGDLSWEPFKQFGEVVVYERTHRADIVARASEGDAVFTNKVVFDDDTMAQLPNLKYIGILATGTNVVDLDAARRRGIVVTNIPAYSTDSVAQLVFAHMLNVLNRVDEYAIGIRAGRWANNPDFCYWDNQIREFASMRFGVFGLGNIGSKVARIAVAMGAEVLAFTSKPQSELPEGVRKVSKEELFAESDILSLHCPLTPDTKELIRKETISQMKPGMIIINTGRGPLVNEEDVAEALNNGQLGAYAADVMTHEPPRADNPLFKCNNCYLTPHLAWGSLEARKRLMVIAENNIRAFINGNPINRV